jgi:chaperonin GroEL (HSP60 family)
MSDASQQLVIRTLANGATAQLRTIIEEADRDEARRIHSELIRIAAQLREKHGFAAGGTHQKRPAAVELLG